MKKITIMIAALGASLAFTACQDSADDHPVLGKTEGQVVDFLDTPADAAGELMITNENKEEYVHMTCSQPKEYGFQAPVTYEVEVALNSDFETPVVEGCPAAVVLATSFHNPEQINPSNEEIARAMCKMLNIQSAGSIPTDFHKLFVRLIANVTTTSGQPYEGTTLVSNTVTLDNVAVGYLAIVVPGIPSGIFLRGGMNGWGADPAWEFVTTTEENVYEIEDCSIAKGVEFKVADASWGSINYGMGDGELKFNEPYVLTGGGDSKNISMPADFNGRVQLTVKGGKYEILFEAAEPDVPGQATGVFIKGDLNGWSADPACEFLTTDIKNCWQIADITIPAGSFKVADANWGPINLGANAEPIEVGVPYTLVPGGQDNITLTESFTGTATLKIKGGNYILTLTPAAE